jgi:hypothetical protein
MLDSLTPEEREQVTSISNGKAVLFCMMGSLSLVVFYFLIKFFTLNWLITGLFVCMSVTILTSYFMDLLDDYVIKRSPDHWLTKEYYNSPITLHFLAGLTISLSLNLAWVITHNWLLSNLIAISFVFNIFRVI